MNLRELTTWQRLCELDFDASDSALPFSARLARDNGWSVAFAGQAIEEYRRFCFLAVHAGHPVTPSEIDQVWHLHLLYSRHYWEALCRDALEMPLHHGPTQGGFVEGRKYHAWYEDTLASYRRFFGEPPKDLWPSSSDERFDGRNDFILVNRRDVVALDRVLLRRGTIASLLGGGVLVMAHALAQVDDAAAPGASVGIWLVLVAVLLTVAFVVAASRRTRARKRRKGDAAAAVGGAGCGSTPRRRVAPVARRTAAAPVAVVPVVAAAAVAAAEAASHDQT